MKIAKLFCTLALSVGAACVNNAYAVTIQSSVSDFGYRLIDVDPTDGIAPSINFTSAFSQTYANFCNCGGGTGEAVDFAFDFPSNITSGGTNNGLALRSSISPTDYMAYAGSSTAGSLGTVTTTSDVSFTLSANTQVVFYGIAHISQAGYHGESGTLSGAAGASIYQADTGAELSGYTHSVSESIGATSTPYSESFTLLYDNTGSAEFLGKFSIGTASLLQVSAVPEPSSYAMLAAGLLLIGASARRRTAAKNTA